MTKAEMINAIINTAHTSALAHDKHFDFADTFFSLAFMSDANLRKLCKQLKIAR